MASNQKIGDLIRSKFRQSSSRRSSIYDHQIIPVNFDQFTNYQPEHIIRRRSKSRQEKTSEHEASPAPSKPLTTPIPDQVQANLQSNRMSSFSHPSNLQLDPRDERILIPFDSDYYRLMEKSNFEISCQPFRDQIRDWLVDVVEIITSISFNHMKKETFTDKEAKNFAAKNILLNIKEIAEKYNRMQLEHRIEFTKLIDEEMYKIFKNVIQKYPQTSSRGASKRIKSRIPKIDNRQSDEYDFLFQNNIQIQYKEDEDYSEDIMKIINKLSSFSNEVFDTNDEQLETNYEVFTEIMEYIFENSYLQNAMVTAKEVVEIIGRKKCVKEEIPQDSKNLINQIFGLGDALKDEDSKKSSYIKDSHRTFAIGHKIPSGIKQFSDEDIEAANFKVYDSSILRLLTKWADQLRSKLTNAEQTIYKRLYKFKNNSGKLINLQSNLRDKLYEAAVVQLKNVNKYLKYLKEQNAYLQTLFAEQQNIGKYTKRDTKVGVFAAKLNEISSQYTYKYINKLIHSLLSISKRASQQVTSQRESTILESVNLVSFKIGDLMRCKCSCSEQQFIRILMVLDELHEKTPQIFKIVRIKNRLEQKDNDILINFYFMNKAQCEMQLSIIGNQNKNEKNYSNFNHFIYEIIRSELGPISEMATIVSQFDPLINNFGKLPHFSPELVKKTMTATMKSEWQKKIQERIKIKETKQLGRSIEIPFVCCNCQNLAIVNNPKYYFRDEDTIKTECNDCRLTEIRKMQQESISDYLLRVNFKEEREISFFKKHLKLWDLESFIKQTQEIPQDQVSARWIPKHGFLLKKNQRYAKMELYTFLYETASEHLIFATHQQNGCKKLLHRFPFHCEKKKRIQLFKNEFLHFCLFEFYNGREVIEGEDFYYQCTKQGCCGERCRAGNYLPTSYMKDKANHVMIEHFFDNQISILYLNNISNAFDKVKTVMKQYEGPKLWKIMSNFQAIQASTCSLTEINIVNKFHNLFELNISHNQQLKSLKGIQACLQLKLLDCQNCNIEHTDELSKLQRLEYLNVSYNKNLRCLKGLTNHTEISEIYLSNTSVRCLSPLSKCSNLQSLDIQNCPQIQSLNSIKSNKLAYINLVNCTNIQMFDLPLQTAKSLKNIQLYQQASEKMAYHLIFSSLKLMNKSSINFDETIEKINSVLKARRSSSESIERSNQIQQYKRKQSCKIIS